MQIEGCSLRQAASHVVPHFGAPTPNTSIITRLCVSRFSDNATECIMNCTQTRDARREDLADSRENKQSKTPRQNRQVPKSESTKNSMRCFRRAPAQHSMTVAKPNLDKSSDYQCK